MPTGLGKSAIYEIAGALIRGPRSSSRRSWPSSATRSSSLREVGFAAAELNSNVSRTEREEALAALADGALEYLFLAPEQLANEESLGAVVDARPSLFVVWTRLTASATGATTSDPSTCVSAPSRILGLTATAAPPVRGEIVERLGLRDPRRGRPRLHRPNIWLGVERVVDERRKRDALLELAAEAEKPGIVYGATRRRTEELADALRERAVDARPYHAGLAAREREDAQEAFMDAAVDVIVSTIAFGMGVDKPNVRFVFHYDISDSVDSLYQELGRAGATATRRARCSSTGRRTRAEPVLRRVRRPRSGGAR